jgi:hypothetical protein
MLIKRIIELVTLFSGLLSVLFSFLFLISGITGWWILMPLWLAGLLHVIIYCYKILKRWDI